jgi:RimJ/RimL family protein N-acetyltransferase
MAAKFQIVKNSPKYWEFIRTLRNMEGIRGGFIQQEIIDEIQHATYMLQFNNNFWICLDNDIPMGYVGIIDDDIRVATHPDFQGRGVAAFMINEIMKLHPTAVAKVKLDNKASLRLFESCGFKKKYYLLEKDVT